MNFIKTLIKFAILAVPMTFLLVPNSMFFPYITGKAIVFRVLVEIALGLYVALAIVDKSYRPKRSILLTCLSIFVAVVFVADVFSPNPLKAFWSNFERMEGFVTIAHLYAYFVILFSVFRERKDWFGLLFTSVGVSVFVSLFGIFQLAGELGISQGGSRIDGTFGNAAYMATYLLFHIFLVMFLYRSHFGKLRGIAESMFGGLLAYAIYVFWHIGSTGDSLDGLGKIVLATALVLSALIIFARYFSQNEKFKYWCAHVCFALVIATELTLLYFTATRGAVLGLLGGVFLGAVSLLILKKENKTARNAGLIVALGIVVLVALFISFRNLPVIEEDPVLSRFASISWSEAKGQARNIIWPMAIKGIKDRPVLGWGQEGFNFVFQKYYEPELWKHEPWFDRAHNSFLDWLVSAGVLGLLSYMSIYISALYLLFKKSNFDFIEKSILFGLLSAYAFQSLFIFDNLVSYILFFTLLALIGGSCVGSIESAGGERMDDSDAKIVITTSLIGVLVLAYFINWNIFNQNIKLVQAISIGGMKDGELVSCEKIVKQISPEDGRKVNVCARWSPTLDLYKGVLAYGAMGRNEIIQRITETSQSINNDPEISQDIKNDFVVLSISEYEKEIKRNPLDAKNYLSLGIYLNGLGAPDQALTYLLKAEELSPRKQQILFQLGSSYLMKNDVEKSYEYMKRAYELAPEFGDARTFYAAASLFAKKEGEALQILEEDAKKGHVDTRIVRVFFQLKQGQKVAELLEMAIKANPLDRELYELLSQVYTELGQANKAKEVMDRF